MSRTRDRLAVLAGVAALLSTAVPAIAAGYLAQSTFSASDEGWRLTSTLGYDGPVSWSGTGGNPGGFIYGQDPDTGAFGFLAPEKFRGPMGAALHHELTFDVAAYQQPDGPTSWVGMRGTNGLELACSYASPASPLTWYHRTVWMDATADWTVVATGLPASDAQILSVLQNLENLAICAEFVQGLPTDVSGLDNVTLVPPNPGPSRSSPWAPWPCCADGDGGARAAALPWRAEEVGGNRALPERSGAGQEPEAGDSCLNRRCRAAPPNAASRSQA